MRLYQAGPSSDLDVDTVLGATKSDALKGLGPVLEAAQKQADKAVPTVKRVVKFLLR